MNGRRSMNVCIAVAAAVALMTALLAFGQRGVTARAQEETPAPLPPVAGATRVREADGAVMVYVPAGEFVMGSPEREGNCDEHPQHTVYLDAFWIDRTEVTNRQFEQFVQATGYRTLAETQGTVNWRHPEGPRSNLTGRANDPVARVSWDDGQAYCEWAGGRLPSEAEWEKAACGTDGRRYPWGNQDVTCEYAVMNVGVAGCGQGWKPWPVGSKPPGVSPYGALDMAGNAWEWVADWYDAHYYAVSPARNPPGPVSGRTKVARGGSWAEFASDSKHGCRHRDIDMCSAAGGGFRCATPAGAPNTDVTMPVALQVPARILFIGDSLSLSLGRYLPQLAASGDPPIRIETGEATAVGVSLCFHRNVKSGLDDIRAGKWDVVVLEESLLDRWPYGVQYFYDCVRQFDADIRQGGARTVLYMPWPARRAVLPSSGQMAGAISSIARELGAGVAPVGLAFARAMQERPELDLIAMDGDHPSAYGYYLLLNVLYATIFERSSEGYPYRLADVTPDTVWGQFWQLPPGWEISEQDAAFLQRIAWETETAYRIGRLDAQTEDAEASDGMSPAVLQSQQVVKDWMDAIMAKDWQKLGWLYANDCVCEEPATLQMPVLHCQWSAAATFGQRFSNGDTFVPRSSFVSEDGAWAAVEWDWKTANERTGKPVTVRTVSVLTIKGRKIVRQAEYWDAASLQ